MGAMILIADDDRGMRETLETVLAEDGHTVRTAADGAETLRRAAERTYDLILLDLRMPDCSGLELLPRLREIAPESSIVMMTAYGTVRSAVEAVKQGAFDFLTKPFELEEMRNTIRKALEIKTLTRENMALRLMLEEKLIARDIVGTGPAMRQVFETVAKVVDYDVTVLLHGESGTGKELIAQALHDHGPRRDKPFVKLNCAALPDTLLESELFGYEKGAFTGAAAGKPGRFELADGGTFFLDEIADTSLNMQAKLLRVLQEKEFERVGGRRTIKVDVRIVAATNKDLRAEVEAKRFREDLFYRLNVVPLHIPPLRERREDLPALVAHFLNEFNRQFRKGFTAVSPEAMACFMRYRWPGNVRELRNVLEKAVLLGEGPTVLVSHLPPELAAGVEPAKKTAGEGEPATLDALERDHIRQVLAQVNWNQRKAAEILGIHRNTLRKKIRCFGLREEGGP